MNIRTIAFGAVALALFAPASFAASNSDYQNCIGRDKPNNGGVPCEALLDGDMAGSHALAVPSTDMEGKKSVYLFDTWPGKSTK